MTEPDRRQAESAFPAGAELGEGPVWDTLSGTLFWVDVLVGRVHRFWPGRGVDVAARVGSSVSAVAVRKGGGLVLALDDAVGLVEPEEVAMVLTPQDGLGAPGAWLSSDDLRVARLAMPAFDPARVRFNDAAVDPEGRFLVGTMDWEEAAPIGAVYQVSADGDITQLLDGVTESNGIDIADDGRTLYYVDSATGGVSAFERAPETGALRRPRRIIEVPPAEGVPDGLTLDAEGCLWIAIWGAGEVRRYRPDGRLLSVVEVATRQVSSMAFGGDRLEELFITTARTGLDHRELSRSAVAGDVFWCESGTTGRQSPRFAG